MPALFSLTGACQWLCVQKFDHQGRVFKKKHMQSLCFCLVKATHVLSKGRSCAFSVYSVHNVYNRIKANTS